MDGVLVKEWEGLILRDKYVCMDQFAECGLVSLRALSCFGGVAGKRRWKLEGRRIWHLDRETVGGSLGLQGLMEKEWGSWKKGRTTRSRKWVQVGRETESDCKEKIGWDVVDLCGQRR
jgi:hypothetical protein